MGGRDDEARQALERLGAAHTAGPTAAVQSEVAGLDELQIASLLDRFGLRSECYALRRGKVSTCCQVAGCKISLQRWRRESKRQTPQRSSCSGTARRSGCPKARLIDQQRQTNGQCRSTMGGWASRSLEARQMANNKWHGYNNSICTSVAVLLYYKER